MFHPRLRLASLVVLSAGVLACKSKPAASKAPPDADAVAVAVDAAPPPVDAAAAAPDAAAAAPAPVVTLPGACVPIGDDTHVAEDLGDLDGDGVADAVVSALPGDKKPTACDRSDDSCPQTVYVRRGTCGHAVGTLPGNHDRPTLATTRSHGLADLAALGADGAGVFVFDGTRYVEQP